MGFITRKRQASNVIQRVQPVERTLTGRVSHTPRRERAIEPDPVVKSIPVHPGTQSAARVLQVAQQTRHDKPAFYGTPHVFLKPEYRSGRWQGHELPVLQRDSVTVDRRTLGK